MESCLLPQENTLDRELSSRRAGAAFGHVSYGVEGSATGRYDRKT
jgi:hypothetical protein